MRGRSSVQIQGYMMSSKHTNKAMVYNALNTKPTPNNNTQ